MYIDSLQKSLSALKNIGSSRTAHTVSDEQGSLTKQQSDEQGSLTKQQCDFHHLR